MCCCICGHAHCATLGCLQTRSKSLLFFLDCVQAQVLYDFTAEPGNNELTVKEGETVTITNQVNLYRQHSFVCGTVLLCNISPAVLRLPFCVIYCFHLGYFLPLLGFLNVL